MTFFARSLLFIVHIVTSMQRFVPLNTHKIQFRTEIVTKYIRNNFIKNHKYNFNNIFTKMNKKSYHNQAP